MAELFWRIRSKIEEIFDKIPGLPEIFLNDNFKKKIQNETTLCKKCYPEDGIGGLDLPDDFDDIKLEKDQISYDIKMSNLKPEKWKMVGRNLLNMAYADPQFGKEPDDDTDEEDPLPPPPEPTAYVKSHKYPLISVKATGINVIMLEELGQFFYDCADYIEMGTNGKPVPPQPSDDTLEEEEKLCKEIAFDPYQAIEDERTIKKTITTSDVFPGEPFKPFQDDDKDWMKLCDQEVPDSDDDLQVYEL